MRKKTRRNCIFVTTIDDKFSDEVPETVKDTVFHKRTVKQVSIFVDRKLICTFSEKS